MADIIGQETWTANGKSYVVKVTEPGATVTENAISIISPVRVIRGDESAAPLQPILESEIKFTIRDNGKLFQSAILGKQIGDIVIEFTEDSNTLFKGYVIPEVERSLIHESNPTYEVTGFDGIRGLKGFTYDQTGDQTVRQQIYNISNKIGLSLQLNQVFEWEHTGADSGTDDVDKLRICTEQLLALDEDASYYDVLEQLCRFYVAQFFQEDGEWYFMQRAERGASMTVFVTDSAGTAQADETGDFIYNVLNSTLHRKDSFFDQWPAVARVMSKHQYPEYTLRNADWSQGNRYWVSTGGDEAGTNGRRFTDNNATLTQAAGRSFLITDTSLDRVFVKFDFWLNVVSGSGTHNVKVAEVKAIASDGTVRYSNGSGVWGASQTYIEQSAVDFSSHILQGPFTFTLSTAQMPLEPMIVEVTLYFDKDASGNPSDLEYMEVGPVLMLHITPDPEQDVYRPESLTVIKETGELGDAIEDTFGLGDTDGDLFMAPGVMEYDNGSTWIPTSSWQPSSNTIHDKRATDVKDQVDERLEVYDFSHAFGEDPKLYNALAYDNTGGYTANIYVPTYIEKEYERNAKIKAYSSSKQLLDASAVITIAPTFIYWGDSDGNIKKAEINDSSVPWSATTIGTITSGRSFRDGYVDQIREYIFTLEINSTANLNYLMRRDLDGSNLTELLQWDTSGTDPQGWAFAIQRIAERVAVVVLQSPTAGNNYEVKAYDYDGTFDENIIGQGGRTAGQAIAFDEDETYMVLADRLGSSKKILRVTVSDGTEFEIYSDYVQDGSGEDSRFVIDSTEGKVWFFAPEGSSDKITHYPFPGSGSESVWKTTTDGIEQWGLAIDRSRGRVIYPTTTNGDIAWDTYAETDEQTVYDPGAGVHPSIEWICTGFN